MNRARLISLVKITATIVILVLSLYFSVWKVNIDELGKSFETADYGLALLVIPIVLLSHYLRAHRWKVILRTVHPQVPTQKLFVGVLVGYFMNNIIPRSGELARPYITAQHDKDATFSSLLGTIIVERFIDTVALLLIISGVLLFDTTLFSGFEGYEDAIRNMLVPTIVLGIIFLVIAPSRFASRIVASLTRPLPDGLRAKVTDIFFKLQHGFGSIRSLSQASLVLIETVAIYFLYMLPLYVMFYAFPSGAAAAPTLFDATRILAITALAFAVAPTPGAFGVFHASARISVMSLLHFTYADAVAYATLTHFINYATVMVVGGYFLARYNISFKDLLRPRS